MYIGVLFKRTEISSIGSVLSKVGICVYVCVCMYVYVYIRMCVSVCVYECAYAMFIYSLLLL